MKENEIILRLLPRDGFDQEKFVIDLANGRPVDLSKCQVFQINNVVSEFREAIIQEILKNGLSGFLRRRLLLEKVVPPGRDSNYVADIIMEFLKVIDVDDELVIVDPYFFASTSSSDYPALVQSILSPFATQLRAIRVVTLPDKVDPILKQTIEAVVKRLNAAIEMTHSTSRDYHDRFWISSARSKGILLGSSLNGLGRRYAIVDRLSATDVKDVVDSLVASKLI